MQFENEVTVSGLLHHIKSEKKSDKYFLFSIRQETQQSDGTLRKDFLASRVFVPEIQEQVRPLAEGTPLKVRGVLQSSLGSGDMYINIREVQTLE